MDLMRPIAIKKTKTKVKVMSGDLSSKITLMFQLKMGEDVLEWVQLWLIKGKELLAK